MADGSGFSPGGTGGGTSGAGVQDPLSRLRERIAEMEESLSGLNTRAQKGKAIHDTLWAHHREAVATLHDIHTRQMELRKSYADARQEIVRKIKAQGSAVSKEFSSKWNMLRQDYRINV